MAEDIIQTIKQAEDEANAGIFKAQETSGLAITAKEKELREKLENLDETLAPEIRAIKDLAQKEIIKAEKEEKSNQEGAVRKISQTNFEKAREFILTSLARMFTE